MGTQPNALSEQQSPAAWGPGADERLAFTIRHAARALDVSEPFFRKVVNKGLVPSFKLGNRRLVARTALLELLDQATAQRRSEVEDGGPSAR